MFNFRSIVAAAAAALFVSSVTADAAVSIRLTDNTGGDPQVTLNSDVAQTSFGGFDLSFTFGNQDIFPPLDRLFGSSIFGRGSAGSDVTVEITGTNLNAPADGIYGVQHTALVGEQSPGVSGGSANVWTVVDDTNAPFGNMAVLLNTFTTTDVANSTLGNNFFSGPYSITHIFRFASTGAEDFNATADYTAIPVPAALPLLLGGLGLMGFVARRRRAAA